ncbi:alpha/beta fold hydrolase [Aurantiacibacter sediminis]|uniref:Alpha/beta hydrolase n=1 Tax=Aurantiacibacter sediminis TaxID=2793064 RepID=A0ABS0N1E6_9SPHN|nr:alpha/beta hydrolase [Aurantiacibacter sediminis]MBH5321782.1 alpha/beta hydrolase [Aurantiacibacter sediminis]
MTAILTNLADEEALIKAAYGVVSRPQRLIDLLHALQDNRVVSSDDVEPLADHFAQVTELITEVDEEVGRDFSNFHGISASPGEVAKKEVFDSQVQLSLDRDGKVVSYDPAVFGVECFEEGPSIPDWMSETDRDGFRAIMASMRATGTIAPSLIRLLTHFDDETGQLFSVEPSQRDGIAAEFRSIRLRWSNRVGELFVELFKLTKTQGLLARDIVNGRSVKQFAERRGRSEATARTQLKVLLKKLGLSSQIELVSLYAGFHFRMQFLSAEETAESANTGLVHTLPDGNILPYEVHGDPDGRPVLYLHATADGAYFTPKQQRAAKEQGLRVIAPWLPFYAGSRFEKHGLLTVDAFVDRLENLLDALDIPSCAIITVRVSAPYGLRAIQRNPKRFTRLVAAGTIVPVKSPADFAHLTFGYRAPMRLARSAPSFVKLYFAAAAAMMRRGEGGKFLTSLYENSPADLRTLDDPDVVEVMKASLLRTYEESYDAPLQQTLLSSSDWSEFCENIEAHVTIICGQEDGLGTPHQVQDFCERYGFTLEGPLENVGSLAIHQVPSLIFERV